MSSFLLIDKHIHCKHIMLVKNLMYFKAKDWRRYKSFIFSLKAVIADKSLISARLDIDRILHFVFMIKYSKFTENIESGNVTDTFFQNTDKFQKSGEGGYTTYTRACARARYALGNHRLKQTDWIVNLAIKLKILRFVGIILVKFSTKSSKE